MDTEDWNERANILENYKESMNIINEYEDIIKTNIKNSILFAYQ